MAQKLKKHKKKVKVKIPKIQYTKDGRKFVKVGKKTVYLDDDVTPNQLLKFVLDRVIKKPQKRVSGKTKEGKRSIEIARPTSTVSSGPSNGIDRVAKLLEEQKRDLERKEYEKKLHKKIDDEIADKIPKDQQIVPVNKQSGEKKSGEKKKAKVPIYDNHGNKIEEYEIDEDLRDMYTKYTNIQNKEIQKAEADKAKAEAAKQKAEAAKAKAEADKAKTEHKNVLKKIKGTSDEKDVEIKKIIKDRYRWQDLQTMAADAGIKGKTFVAIVPQLLEQKLIDPEKDFKDQLAYYNKKLQNLGVQEARLKKIYEDKAQDYQDVGLDMEKVIDGKLDDNEDDSSGDDEDLGIDMDKMKPTRIQEGKENDEARVGDDMLRIEAGTPPPPLEFVGEGRSSSRGLYTTQIERMMESYKPNYLGCIAANEVRTLLPLVKKQRQLCFIQNTDSNRGKGIHWVAWFIDRDRKTVEYYDSLADPLPKDLYKNVQPLLKKISARGDKWKWKYNVLRDQNLTSSTCGFFAMLFLRDRLFGIPFKIASHYVKGEKRVKEVMKNMKHQFGYVDGLSGEGWRDVLASAWNATKNLGKRVVDGVKSVINLKPRDGWSPSIRKILEVHGSKNISNITLYRQPIQSFVSKALNWVTMGKFNENIKNAGYDAAMHLYLTFTLQDGTTIRFDKNHVLEATFTRVSSNVESMPVGTKNIPLNDFLNKGIDYVGKEKYFIYDSRTQNCQWWIIWNLQANGLLTSTIKNWVLQDADAIYKNLGLLEKVNRGITDVAAVADTALFGAGRPKFKIVPIVSDAEIYQGKLGSQHG